MKMMIKGMQDTPIEVNMDIGYTVEGLVVLFYSTKDFPVCGVVLRSGCNAANYKVGHRSSIWSRRLFQPLDTVVTMDATVPSGTREEGSQ